MARRVFPDERFTYALAGVQWLAGAPVPGVVGMPPGMPMSVFTDAAGLVPADVRHLDGSVVDLSAPLVVDAYSQVPLFLGPDDDSDTLYAVVAGGPPAAIYARADDRIDALETATAGLNQPDDATALANPSPGIAGFVRAVFATLVNKGGILVKGNSADTVGKNLYEAQDGGGAPAWAIGSIGGEYLNDQFRQHYDLNAAPTVQSSIYGYRMQGGLTEFAWSGPPGNMCSFADACHEVFESTRSGSKGGWQVAFGSASDAASVTETSPPTLLRHAVELTSHTTSMTALTGAGSLALPVTAGATYTALANVKAVATVRSPQVGMQWWDSGSVFISTTVGTGTATNTSGYTLITSGTLTAPAGAVYGAPCIVWPTSVNGEKHRVAGVGVWAGTVTEWAPPFVGAPWNTWGQAAAGDIWRRKSAATDPNARLYICTTGGIPAAQVWTALGTAPLSSATPAAVATAGAAGSAASGARSDHAHAGVVVNTQTFTTTGTATWNKPTAGTIAIIDVIAAGGGSGAGRRGAAATVRSGGAGGGAGGVIASRIVPLSALGATETVTVGAGGTAGAAATVNDTNGGAGGNGGNSSFGSWLVASGGGGGGGGTATGATGGGGGAGDDFSPQGVNADATGLAGSNANSGYARPGAGASGGGLTAANATSSGGNGAGVGMRNYTGSGSGGGAGAAGGAATDMTAGVPLPGPSGGGGGSSGTAAGGAGAAGGRYGAGASGGGASLNGFNSGAGAVGGQGIVQVVVM